MMLFRLVVVCGLVSVLTLVFSILDVQLSIQLEPVFRQQSARTNATYHLRRSAVFPLVPQTVNASNFRMANRFKPPPKGPPLRIVVAHLPRSDTMGSFVRPTVELLAICHRYGWQLEILPFEGSNGKFRLEQHIALGSLLEEKLGAGWGTGIGDISYRSDYDAVQLNKQVYEVMGFFPPVPETAHGHEWIASERLVPPGERMDEKCRYRRTNDTCYLKVSQETDFLDAFMDQQGGLDTFFPLELRQSLRNQFLVKNEHRLVDYNESCYNVAIHVRRGDINHLPWRWTNQQDFYNVVYPICQNHSNVHVRVFSSGLNKDGNWTTLEALSEHCGNVTFHIDEHEFDSWTFMVRSDALVLSKSSFSYVAALLQTTGEVYCQRSPRLSHWNLFPDSSRAARKRDSTTTKLERTETRSKILE